MQLSELAQQIQAELVGADAPVDGVNTIQDASESEICFLTSQKHAAGLSDSCAAAVIVDTAIDDCPMAQLVVDNVNAGLIAALKLFAPKLTELEGVHPSAVVEADAQLSPTAIVGPNAYIGHGVQIGAETVIGPGCSIGENTTIGPRCRLESNAVIYHDCQIGSFCVIGANTTIGGVGFGYSYIDGQHQLIPHNGGVILEDGVEIGCNSCVDRAKFGNTLIGAGTKIDNLVQVAHNAQIGRLCLLAGHVGISGSTVVGDGVIFAGASGTSDNITVGDGAIIGAQSAAVQDIAPGEKVWGDPPQPLSKELRCKSVYRNLPELAKEIKQLRKKVAKLEAAKDDKN
ncbi:MAG: UDP-3-O-(3-hydroxymyristoyl)glucosamine N-acyltransferase [Planctomycetota bacterium]|jgi:UDP-3-O-[3-hydroxymyristoyl] glucosamine N-acyltransferase